MAYSKVGEERRNIQERQELWKKSQRWGILQPDSEEEASADNHGRTMIGTHGTI